MLLRRASYRVGGVLGDRIYEDELLYSRERHIHHHLFYDIPQFHINKFENKYIPQCEYVDVN